MATHIIQNLYLSILLSLICMVVSRNFKRVVMFYVIHSFLLCYIFIWYGFNMGNRLFYIWAFSAFIFRVIIIPFAPGGLLYTIKGFIPRETKPIVPMGPSFIFITALMVGTWKLFHSYIDLIAPTQQAAQEPSRTNLAIAFTIFVLGIYTLLTRRDAIKTVLGLAIMENGVHLALVDLTPTINEAILLGMLSTAVITLFILLYLSRCIYLQLGVSDTVQLSELRY